MPWENAHKKNNELKSIADSDRKILIPMLDKEKEAVDKFIKNGDIKYNGDVHALLKKLFNDFEHAFDGNFENPKVIILGINPKMSNINHDSYNLQGVYEEPFCKYRATLFSENPKDNDYYFSETNGLFFKGMDKTAKSRELRKKFMKQVNCKTEETPFALWEFFRMHHKMRKYGTKMFHLPQGPKGLNNFLIQKEFYQVKYG